MTNRSVAALALKIWGVMWLVDAAMSLVNTALQFVFQEFGDRSLWMYAIRMNTVSWAVGLLIGLVLVRRGEAIARALFPKEESVALDLDAPKLQAIGFSIVAVYLAIGGLRDLATGLYPLLARRTNETLRNALPASNEHFVGALVQLAAAVALFFGVPRLTRFARRLQEPWTATPDGPGAADPNDPKG